MAWNSTSDIDHHTLAIGRCGSFANHNRHGTNQAINGVLRCGTRQMTRNSNSTTHILFVHPTIKYANMQEVCSSARSSWGHDFFGKVRLIGSAQEIQTTSRNFVPLAKYLGASQRTTTINFIFICFANGITYIIKLGCLMSCADSTAFGTFVCHDVRQVVLHRPTGAITRKFPLCFSELRPEFG